MNKETRTKAFKHNKGKNYANVDMFACLPYPPTHLLFIVSPRLSANVAVDFGRYNSSAVVLVG
jgi:hypothetical protein